ncbi:MAG: cob(I)yrinic acid a,c-diamide adenosyltransferase [Flavobacteriia bacterium]|nr:cob(I)yrinic acid a,c-diamide adenosyltransferase [Flavobacteriia bacterium]
MKIYTKTGDQGMTSLFNGKRVGKNDLNIESYGTLDELNAWIGLLREAKEIASQKSLLLAIQKELFEVGAILANPTQAGSKPKAIKNEKTEALEAAIDSMELHLEPLTQFILPGGNACISHCHLARTVSRRAERLVVALHATQPIDVSILEYLNRLSDYLFVLSRLAAKNSGISEEKWLPES